MTPGQTVFVVDATAMQVISELSEKVDCLMQMVEKRNRATEEENPWLPAVEFCKRYHMGRSTLARRMKETPCRIEVLDPNEKIKKYRWKEGMA